MDFRVHCHTQQLIGEAATARPCSPGEDSAGPGSMGYLLQERDSSPSTFQGIECSRRCGFTVLGSHAGYYLAKTQSTRRRRGKP